MPAEKKEEEQAITQEMRTLAVNALQHPKLGGTCRLFLEMIRDKNLDEEELKGAFAGFWNTLPENKRNLFVGPGINEAPGVLAMINIAKMLAGGGDEAKPYHILMPTLVHDKLGAQDSLVEFDLGHCAITRCGKYLLHQGYLREAFQRSQTLQIQFIADDADSQVTYVLEAFEINQFSALYPGEAPAILAQKIDVDLLQSRISPATIALLREFHSRVGTSDGSMPDSMAVEYDLVRMTLYQDVYERLKSCTDEELNALNMLRSSGYGAAPKNIFEIFGLVLEQGQCMSETARCVKSWLDRHARGHVYRASRFDHRIAAWAKLAMVRVRCVFAMVLTGGIQIMPVTLDSAAENASLSGAEAVATQYTWRNFLGIEPTAFQFGGKSFGGWDTLIRCMLLAPLITTFVRNLLVVLLLGPLSFIKSMLSPLGRLAYLFQRYVDPGFAAISRLAYEHRGIAFFLWFLLFLFCILAVDVFVVMLIIMAVLHVITLLLLPILSPSAALQGAQHYQLSPGGAGALQIDATKARGQKIIWACKAYIALTSLLLFVFAAPLLYGLLGAILPHGVMVSFISFCQHMTSLPVLHQLGVGVAYVVQPILNFFGLSAIPLPVVRAVMSIVALLLVSSLLEYAHQRLSPRVSWLRRNEVDVRYDARPAGKSLREEPKVVGRPASGVGGASSAAESPSAGRDDEYEKFDNGLG